MQMRQDPVANATYPEFTDAEWRGFDEALHQIRVRFPTIDVYLARNATHVVTFGRKPRDARYGSPLFGVYHRDGRGYVTFRSENEALRSRIKSILGKSWKALRADVFELAGIDGDPAFGRMLDTLKAGLASAETARWTEGSGAMPADYEASVGGDSGAAQTHAAVDPKPRLEDDIADIIEGGTERLSEILARIGQGGFRRDVLDLWDGRCAVTGCDRSELLRASHIKPWRDADDRERHDPQNGLPLVATLDALFDRGLLSFADDGTALYADDLDVAELVEAGVIGVQVQLSRPISSAQAAYLQDHRSRFGFEALDA